MNIVINQIEYNNTQIDSLEISESISLIGEEISTNTANFTLKTAKGTILKKKDKVEISDIETLGTFYISNSKLLAKTKNYDIYRVECEDIYSLLDNYNFKGKLFLGETLQVVITELMTGINVIVEIPVTLQGIQIYGYAPKDTVRNTLHNICFTNGLIVDTSRTDKIKIIELSDTLKGDLSLYDIFSNEIDTNEGITGVELTEFDFVRKTLASADVLYQGVIPDNKLIYVEFEPARPITEEGVWFTENCIVVDSGNCWAVLSQGSLPEDEAVFAGYQYYKNSTVKTQGTMENALSLSDNTMINKYNSNGLLTRLLSVSPTTTRITAKFKGLKCSDKVVAHTNFGIVYGRIESQSIRFSSRLHLADMTIKGSLIPFSENIYTTEISTGEDIGVI